MKIKYNLDIYDNIIKEIKNPKSVIIEDIISALLDWSFESHLIYLIKITKSNSKDVYNISKPIHSLHPNAPKLNKLSINLSNEDNNLTQQIVKELKAVRKYFCLKHNKKSIIYLLIESNIEELEFENQYFLYCYKLVKNENEKIKIRIKESVFTLKSREKIKLYIHEKQNAIENIIIRLIKEINPINSDELYELSHNYSKIDCLKIVYIHLEKLSRFIEKEYSNYLNVNIRVPFRSISSHQYKITPKLEYVKSRLLSYNLENKIVQIAYEPILKIEKINIQEKLTYFEFNYCCQFIDELFKKLKYYQDQACDLYLADWLFELNLNTFTLFDYITDNIYQQIENQENNIEKIDILHRTLKKYNQRQSINYNRFKEKLPTIKTQITNWIEEEIDYLQKKNVLEGENSNYLPKTEMKIKLQSGLSVAQLSYFFNLLLQTDMIQHKNQRDVFRFISENFKTKMSNNISLDSISSKYYNVELNTKNAVREKIIELLNLSKL